MPSFPLPSSQPPSYQELCRVQEGTHARCDSPSISYKHPGAETHLHLRHSRVRHPRPYGDADVPNDVEDGIEVREKAVRPGCYSTSMPTNAGQIPPATLAPPRHTSRCTPDLSSSRLHAETMYPYSRPISGTDCRQDSNDTHPQSHTTVCNQSRSRIPHLRISSSPLSNVYGAFACSRIERPVVTRVCPSVIQIAPLLSSRANIAGTEHSSTSLSDIDLSGTNTPYLDTSEVVPYSTKHDGREQYGQPTNLFHHHKNRRRLPHTRNSIASADFDVAVLGSEPASVRQAVYARIVPIAGGSVKERTIRRVRSVETLRPTRRPVSGNNVWTAHISDDQPGGNTASGIGDDVFLSLPPTPACTPITHASESGRGDDKTTTATLPEDQLTSTRALDSLPNKRTSFPRLADCPPTVKGPKPTASPTTKITTTKNWHTSNEVTVNDTSPDALHKLHPRADTLYKTAANLSPSKLPFATTDRGRLSSQVKLAESISPESDTDNAINSHLSNAKNHKSSIVTGHRRVYARTQGRSRASSLFDEHFELNGPMVYAAHSRSGSELSLKEASLYRSVSNAAAGSKRQNIRAAAAAAAAAGEKRPIKSVAKTGSGLKQTVTLVRSFDEDCVTEGGGVVGQKSAGCEYEGEDADGGSREGRCGVKGTFRCVVKRAANAVTGVWRTVRGMANRKAKGKDSAVLGDEWAA